MRRARSAVDTAAMDLNRRIRSLPDLTDLWTFIDGGHGYSAPQLFAIPLDRTDHALPSIIQVYDDDLCQEPDDHPLEQLIYQLAAVVEELVPEGSVAVMRARPGGPDMTEQDRRWCLALHRHLHAAPFATRPLFFATDTSVGIVPPDVLVAA